MLKATVALSRCQSAYVLPTVLAIAISVFCKHDALHVPTANPRLAVHVSCMYLQSTDTLNNGPSCMGFDQAV